MYIIVSVFINDDESGFYKDFEIWFEKLVFEKFYFQYYYNVGEDNVDVYFKRIIMGREVVIVIINGKFDLGLWEQVFYGEFDGKRKKRVFVKIIGE